MASSIAISHDEALEAQVASSLMRQDVGSFVAEAAGESVADFACALAEARVPAGFLVLEKANASRGTEIQWHRKAAADEARVLMKVAIDLYQARHLDQRITETDGVLLVQSNALDSSYARLHRLAARFRVEGAPLMTAVYEAMRIVDPTIVVREGMVGSLVSTPGEPKPVVTAGPPITVDMERASLLDALNEIARQAPGTVWILTRHDRPGGEGYYTLAVRVPEGRVSRFEERIRAM